MLLVIDIECNSLINPTKIWCICCKDITTGERYAFREDYTEFKELLNRTSRLVGHNLLGYDLPVLTNLLGVTFPIEKTIDTLILSKLICYSRPDGHSIESYGEEFGLPKGKFNDWTKWSQEMEDYCVRDVEICSQVYSKYRHIVSDPNWWSSITLEHQFQLVVNSLHNNGFCFNTTRANNLLNKVTVELGELDAKIQQAFPPKLVLVREVHPKLTKHGTLHKGDFRFVKNGDLSEYNGGPFSRCSWTSFNASSHKQVVDVLNTAGWVPIDKTQTHIDTDREINRAKYIAREKRELDLDILYDKLKVLQVYGWKINENNLTTLPDKAPVASRLLAKRILLESRRRTLTEWLGLVTQDNRIHGKFYGIGAWTGRMAHQRPNTANIPNDLDTQGKKKLLGKEMRSLWRAPKNRLLVGVDAEGIQLRVFAHYIDDPEFTEALVKGKKDDKTDPHSLNQRILGDVCKTRSAAKRFIYALLLGAGLWKLAQILECSESEAREALDLLLRRYTGWARLKEETIANDARRGFFIGLDGRCVRIPGDTVSERKHLCMSGYLQNGEAIIMKKATLKWEGKLHEDQSMLVNFVHDEFVIETPNDVVLAERIQKRVEDSIAEVGVDLGLRCPLSGKGMVGLNWVEIH